MKHTIFAQLLALTMLAGCAQGSRDNPDNTPLQGEWEVARTIDSSTLDGTVTALGDDGVHVLKMILVQERTRIGDC